jgi:hypothetical protein
VNQTTEEKRSIKRRRTRCTKGRKKRSLSKEKASKEKRKANTVIIDVRTCTKDHTKS